MWERVLPIVAASTLIRSNAIRAQRLRMFGRIHGLPVIPPPLEELPAIDRELWEMVYDLDQSTEYLLRGWQAP
jgi:hypothetical protein